MIPDDAKLLIYNSAIDGLARATEKRFGSRKLGNRIRVMRTGGSTKANLDAGLIRAVKSASTEWNSELADAIRPLLDSPIFQDVLEEVVRRPWDVTDSTFRDLAEHLPADLSVAEVQDLSDFLRTVLGRLAHELWTLPEIREIYSTYFQEQLVQLGQAQLVESASIRELLGDLRDRPAALGRGEFILGQAAGLPAITTGSSLEAHSLEGQRARLIRESERRAAGSRALRIYDVVTDEELLQSTYAAIRSSMVPAQLRRRPAVELLAELSNRASPGTILLGEAGAGKTITAFAFCFFSLDLGSSVEYVDLSLHRDALALDDFGTREWATTNLGLAGDSEPLLVLDAVDELLQGLSHQVVERITKCWLFSTSHIVCSRRSFYDRVLSWTSFGESITAVELLPWERPMIDRYAHVVLARRNPAVANSELKAFTDLLNSSARISEICENPLRLSMLLDIGDWNAVTEHHESPLKSIYERYVGKYLRYEAARAGSVLSARQKSTLLESVAWHFYDEFSHGYADERTFTIDELTDFLSGDARQMQLDSESVRDDLLFRSLLRLRRSDRLVTSGSVAFLHKSFQEFFVAARVAERLVSGRSEEIVDLFKRLLSPEVSEFLKEFLADINRDPISQDLCFRRLAAAIQATERDYLSDGRTRIARQQLSYYLGNLRTDAARLWLRRILSHEQDPWVARGIVIGLAFGGDNSVLGDYVDTLRRERLGPEGSLNAINVGFHLTFFGDQPMDVEHPEDDLGLPSCAKTVEGLVYQLGTDTDRGSWRLDLYTLHYLATHAREPLRTSAQETLRTMAPRVMELIQRMLNEPEASRWLETDELKQLISDLEISEVRE